MTEKYRSRKWAAFLAVLITELLITVAAAVKMILSDDPLIISSITGFIIACFGGVGTTLAFYFTANVVQKKVAPEQSYVPGGYNG